MHESKVHFSCFQIQIFITLRSTKDPRERLPPELSDDEVEGQDVRFFDCDTASVASASSTARSTRSARSVSSQGSRREKKTMSTEEIVSISRRSCS